MSGTQKQTQTQKSEIDPKLQDASHSSMDALMAASAVNPWDIEYTGPRIAPINKAQMQAMDTAASAGNAYGFDFSPASRSLPKTVMINGQPTYDVLNIARQGISPELEALYGDIWGPNGPFAKYALSGKGKAAAAAGGAGGGREGGSAYIPYGPGHPKAANKNSGGYSTTPGDYATWRTLNK